MSFFYSRAQYTIGPHHLRSSTSAMPQLRRPATLEALAIRALIDFLCKLGDQLLPIITALARTEALTSAIVLESRVAQLQRIFDYNIPSGTYDAVCAELFRVVPLVLGHVKTRGMSRASMAEYLQRVNMIVALSETVVSKHVRHLDFDQIPKMVRHVFFNRLDRLNGLTFLNLSSLSGGWKVEDMEPSVLSGIAKMRQLRYFCLNYDCTDAILLALAEACPHLHTLDVSSSKYIANDSMNLLFRFKALKNVQLYRTSVSMEGYVTLLLKMPHLHDVGRYDEIGRCLEHIVDHYPSCQQFGLTRFSSRFVITRFLQILAEHCAKISFVSIFHNFLLCDLMHLCAINGLTELRLMSCDFFADQVRDVLHVKGCNLTHLHLEHVDEIDMNALMYISQYCPDLQSLTIYNCEMMASTSVYIRRPTVPPFMNLRRLTLIAQCDTNHLEFLLARCLRIEYVKIGTMVPTDDATFGRILDQNPMGCLRELSIFCSEELTIATAYRLVEVCSELTVLNELDGWKAIGLDELEAFKFFLQANNLDVCVKSKRFTE